MKRFIILSFLLMGIFCFSQSSTEEYNSFEHRYEYFNSDGDMIGYKSYNNLLNRWEYYNVQTYKRQSRKYGNYIESIDNINISKIESDLKERGMEVTDKAINKQIKYLRKYLDDNILDKCEHEKTSDYYLGFLEKEINSLDIDGTKNQRDYILKYMVESFQFYLKKATNDCAKK